MKKIILIAAFAATASTAIAGPEDKVRSNAQNTIREYQQRFAKIDIDRSGKLSRDELIFAAERVHRAMDQNYDRQVTDIEYMEARPGTGLFDARQNIARVDINKDKQVSLSEARVQALAAMSNDTNKDGYLSFSETMREAPPAIKRYFDMNYSAGR